MGSYASISTIADMLWNIRNYKVALNERQLRKQVDVGASTNVYYAVSPGVVKAKFYSDNAINVGLLNKQANNQDMARKL